MTFQTVKRTFSAVFLIVGLLSGTAHAADSVDLKLSGEAANATTATARVKPVDSIVAVVNDDVITRHDLDARYERAVQQLQARKTPLPPRAVLEKQLLERMINDRIQLQLAAQTGIRVDAAQLDKAVERIAAQNNLSLPQFQAALKKEGIDFSQFRKDIRDEIILTRLREREVDNKVNISEAEVDAYLENQAKQKQEDQYNFNHILIRIPEGANTEQIQKLQARAQQVLDRLKKGDDFAQVSASYSDAPNALEGGDMGWRASSQLPPLFADTLSKMNAGQLSEILRSSGGFHILRLNDKRGQDVNTVVKQTHARHILIKTNELVSATDAKNRLLQIRERIINGTKFEDMARQYSDDGSAAKGGDLGWLSPGETVPEFERAMDALKPGEISQPIQSPFGYHLIEVLGRRDQDVTKERQRVLARQALRERKIESAQEDWLRQLRDGAYVEYRTQE
jgi:peptidyl-prolyl cis-trans isomerase SurA